MSTDRELLELAAKAAGVPGEYGTQRTLTSIGWEDITAIFLPDGEGWWNPFDDDGDAFRLAVKLDLSINRTCFDKVGISRARCEVLKGYIWQELGLDDEENTRRAIVRAAAEIGRAMP